jgi:hypothetical protein
MSQCHDIYDRDLYDTVAAAPRRRAVPAALTQCHDVYPVFVSSDDDERAPVSEPVRQLEPA